MQLRTLNDLLPLQLERKPRPDCLARKVEGKWVTHSTAEVLETVQQMAAGLYELGVRKGDKVAIISDSRPEWNFTDLACLWLGAVVIPIFPTLTPDNYAYILNHSEAKIAFCGNESYLGKVKAKEGELPGLQHVYTFDPAVGAPHWRTLLRAQVPAEVMNAPQCVEPHDLATIVYTSGTTGVPKGVMLTHANILGNATSVADFGLLPSEELILTKPDFRAISFLPVSHVFERVVIFAYLYRLVPVYYATSVDTVGAELQEVKPYLFTTVPRMLEKVYEKIQAKAADLSPLKRKILFWAIDLVRSYDPWEEENYSWWHKKKLGFARKKVFSKWHEALGGNVGLVVVGAAKMPVELMRIFWGAGVPILEAYGMSETSPGITGNAFAPGRLKIGTVGKPFPNVHVRIFPEPGYPDGEGEIGCKGPNVMMGYYKNPQATSEAIDAEGYMHTGDIGRFDSDGFLVITGRKKELFKTANGKYVALEYVEGMLKSSPFIEQAMAVGEGKKYVAALLVPNFENLKRWATQEGISFADNTALVANSRVKDLIQKELNSINAKLDRHEQVKTFALLPREWTVDTDELTPTMKLKRRVVQANFAAEIEGLYPGRE
jgi:long-chain acyl-CoA synthetase